MTLETITLDLGYPGAVALMASDRVQTDLSQMQVAGNHLYESLAEYARRQIRELLESASAEAIP